MLKLWRLGSWSAVFFGVLLLNSCNGENVPDCFQNAGDLTTRLVNVPQFTKITVFENINLVLRQGDEQRIDIETGEFLQNEIEARVEEDRLLLTNENGCNFIRDYGLTTVYVTSPNLTEVRSSTGLLISSEGILNYPDLRLISESFTNPDAETTDGSFDVEVNAETLRITTNSIAYFELGGTVENLNITVASGDSRIEAQNLTAQNVSINHRGSNDVFINPQQRLTGVIRGTGDVVSSNRPPEVEVDQLFNGRLIFVED